MALRNGLSSLNLATEVVTPILDVEADKPHNRFNDGKCDSAGRFWFGSMCTTGQQGCLYRYSATDGLTHMQTGLTISNGLGWSPDDRTFYLTDSPLQKIFAYDFDATTGNIENRRTFIDLTHESFFPDGLTLDAEGCLWVAMWDGWCVVRFDPNGQEMERVQLPVQRPTSCTFGCPLDSPLGDNTPNSLYITSASVGLSEAEIQDSFLSGDVFSVETHTEGLPNYRFREATQDTEQGTSIGKALL
ncbi:MAG: SMP-30/gluconolactonase/LRE family protein [Merismopedia sp. SIO2A8]|nr:SMP-30/gluconolactonase/LRE family protein [Symploca sp. SIO2B6]NET51387.1 SMP-30/gluconolactonase/LRE family protein [Merismopedia sp. SIO2A8]